MSLDDIGLTLGREIVKHAVRAWLDIRRDRDRRGKDLVELLEVTIADKFRRRDLARRLEDIGDQAANRLRPLYDAEFRDLPENERLAAMNAVADALMTAELDDRTLFQSDADPVKLARAVRDRVPEGDRLAGLSEAAAVLYRSVLDECCIALVNIVRRLPEFQPAAVTELLGRTSLIADDIGQVLERLPRTSLDAPQGTDHDGEFRRRYLESVSTQLDILELFGIDVHRYRPRTRVSVAYFSLTVTSGGRPFRYARDTADDDWFGSRRQQGAAGLRVENALAQRPRTFLRGEAGSGKTTLLQWLAVNCARGSFTGRLAPWNGRVPFLIRLRSFAGERLPQPEQFVGEVDNMSAGIMPTGWVHRQLNSDGLLLVDGVDELVPAQRRRVRTWLGQVCQAFPELPIVVTSRPGAAAPSWLDDYGFGSVLLEPMRPADITEFCHRWHVAIRQASAHDHGLLPCPPDKLDRYEAGLLRHFDTHRHLRALAKTPLLCAMLCALNLDRNMQLPLDRMSLYDAALNMLLERRDAQREIPAATQLRMDTKAKIAVLQHLAWRLTNAGRTEIAFDDCVAHVARAIARLPGLEAEPEPVLQYLLERSGVIRQPALGRVDFVHRTFQEYLAAKEATEDQLPELLVRHADSDLWRETIIMAAGHGTPRYRSALLDLLLDRAEREKTRARSLRLLATACLETAHTVEQVVVERVNATLGTVVPPRSTRESKSLARAGGRVIDKLPASLDGLSEAAAAACVRTAALINGPAALRRLAAYAPDPRHVVQWELAEAWRYFDAEEYARTVLADAPLRAGRIFVHARDHLPYTRHLSRLNSVEAHFFASVDDLSFIADIQFLTLLSCFTTRPISDLSPLLPHDQLRTLRLMGQGVSGDFRHLRQLLRLVQLDISLAGDGSVEFVAELPTSLTSLTIDFDVSATDLQPITALDRLSTIGLWRCPIDPTQYLTELAGLTFLNLDRTVLPGGLTGIRPLMPKLTDLHVTNCSIGDLSPISEAERLETLDIHGNPAWSLEPLAALPRLRYLYLQDITELDVSPLARLPRPARIYVDREDRVRGLEAIRGRHRVVRW